MHEHFPKFLTALIQHVNILKFLIYNLVMFSNRMYLSEAVSKWHG